jgi:hypothetical protein
VGVWDTVGAFGIPSGVGLSALTRLLVSWTRGFHDKEFGNHIDVGLHAMAADEMRRPFAPTMWIGKKGQRRPHAVIEQVWFPGAHSNVGGGYDHCGLSDLALTWMIARVGELTSLEFKEDAIRGRVWPCSACMLYRSNRGWPLSRLRPKIRKVLPELTIKHPIFRWKVETKTENINERVHWSLIERQSLPETLVDGLKGQKYSPRAIKNIPDDRVAERTNLETRIIAYCRGEIDGFPNSSPHCDCLTAEREMTRLPQ